MCFILGKMKGLTYMQYKEYKTAVNTFFRVQAYDAAIYNERLQGAASVSYYTFANSTEQTHYTLGRMLLIQNDPDNATKYVPIEKI
jgi:hypothetical protein